MPLLLDDGHLYVLEDRNQLMYQREPFEIPGAVLIRSREKFRIPHRISDFINLLRLTPEPIVVTSAVSGALPLLEEFVNAADQERLIEAFVTKCLVQGYTLDDIAVLSFHSTQSQERAQTHFGQFSKRRFLGTYDSNGNPHWSEGDLLFESIYRFKGQSAPVVILADLDFSDLDERTCRKLFVGLTRAEDTVRLMLTAAASHVLESRLT
jgi:superfamily I DNA and RNA helicase